MLATNEGPVISSIGGWPGGVKDGADEGRLGAGELFAGWGSPVGKLKAVD
jgi:hypothetical protein